MGADNYAVEWAWQVVARGWPGKDMPRADKVEAYEDLAAAYAVLADQAAKDGDADAHIARSELSARADELAHEYRGPEEQRW
jgi:hypothetical protein